MCARLGGWVLDGFPSTREQWAGMLEQQLIPDCVISLQDSSDRSLVLAERVAELKGIEKLATTVVAAGLDTSTGESIPENVWNNYCCCHDNVMCIRTLPFTLRCSNGYQVCQSMRLTGIN